jgi:hypothetical protein
MSQPANSAALARPRPAISNSFRPQPKSAHMEPSAYSRPEPTYHNVSMSTRPARDAEYVETPRHS